MLLLATPCLELGGRCRFRVNAQRVGGAGVPAGVPQADLKLWKFGAEPRVDSSELRLGFIGRALLGGCFEGLRGLLEALQQFAGGLSRAFPLVLGRRAGDHFDPHLERLEGFLECALQARRRLVAPIFQDHRRQADPCQRARLIAVILTDVVTQYWAENFIAGIPCANPARGASRIFPRRM